MNAVARSAFATSLLRYRRSWGLWLLLLIAPVAARFWIRPAGSDIVVISVNRHVPELTSAVIGVSLGIVTATILLPTAFIYLRSNATVRQPWQIEEVTAASRISIALGRFGADVAVLAGVLGATTGAGWLIGWLLLPAGTVHPGELALALWLVAAPALMGVAAVRILFDARPRLRGAGGETLFFFIWMASLLGSILGAASASGFGPAMTDYAGFLRPLTSGLPMGANTDITIGGTPGGGMGPIAIDVMRGLGSDGYVASRLAWAAIAVGIAAFAGLIHAPHRLKPARRMGRIAGLLAPGPPPASDPAAPSAAPARAPIIGLILAEARLIAEGKLWLIAAAIVAAAGVFADFRTIVSPAALLLLIFGLTAHAGRSESRLLALTRTAAMSPTARRLAFVTAGTAWSVLIGLPAIVRALTGSDTQALLIALATGAVTATAAIALAAWTRSAFAPRLVLLIAWYAYLSTG